MKEGLKDKAREDLWERTSSLSIEERKQYSHELYKILNDRDLSYLYGGMNNKEYAKLPLDKVIIAAENLYNERFLFIIPPRKFLDNCIFFSN